MSSRTIAGPLSVRRPDPQAWQAALALADGDHRRLQLLDDGSILISNTGRAGGPATR